MSKPGRKIVKKKEIRKLKQARDESYSIDYAEAAVKTKAELIEEHWKKHPPFLPEPTMRYYGETLYPWLHRLEELLE